jgi:phenylacetyl-CoA:acceptor oxidoreductase 26-kDa subunit
MSFGPSPWQQTNWDWRAAGNFMGGGAGAGLVILAALTNAPAALLVAGLALIGIGLSCVWAEIGRPLRALHVFFNPQTSWMTREGIVATLLMPVGLACAAAWPALGPAAALLALAFVYCQGRILRAARGIPAWREPRVVPFVVCTGLAEGASLLMIAAPARVSTQAWLFGAVALLLLARIVLWAAYHQRLAARARDALAPAARGLRWAGTLLPLALMALVAAEVAPPPLLVPAGLLAAAAGAWFKFALITRAGFNQGFALTRLPVRGVRR